MKYFIILSVMLLAGITASAQNCSYSLFGTVKAFEDKLPLTGAAITLVGEEKIAVSDINGHFHFNNLCAGNYRVKISYLGFSTEERDIVLKQNQEIEITLNSRNNQLEEINVISAAGVAKPLQTAVKLDGQTLELTRGESLGEALKRLPGVNSIQTGPAISKPVIHGMHSNRVLIFNSGVRIEGQQWGSEHAPEVDPFLANEISVVKGAASVQYGSDALGGVILVNQGDLNFHRHFSGNINVVGASNN
ncbi:MAG: TonB-dependent receptor, partial [Chryseobacterium sp.]